MSWFKCLHSKVKTVPKWFHSVKVKTDCKSEDSTSPAYGINRGFANKDTLINNNNNTLRKREKTEREQSKRGWVSPGEQCAKTDMMS